MSDIICRWLNVELRLSKSVAPRSFSKDFANGYLIGEILHKYQLQEDFDLFLKSNSASSKLNNFTRVEPTLKLLGVSLNLSMAVMQEEHGAATRLLYQLYLLLQKKKMAGLTGTAMEAMRPAGTAFLHRLENDIYRKHLRTVVKREADQKLQKIALKYELKGQAMCDKSVMARVVEEQKRQRVLEEMRHQDVEKLRRTHKKQREKTTQIQTATIQIPKPPPNRTSKALEGHQRDWKSREAEKVCLEISQFEKNRRKLSPAERFGASSLSAHQTSSFHTEAFGSHSSQAPGAEETAAASSEYIQRIRRRLEEDSAARQQREKRRRRFLVQQLKAHEAQEEALREEQLVERLTRQSQQEKRLAVQLMQLRQQKEVILQNRLLRDKQHQERRQRDFQEALDRESALARQASLDHAEEIRKQMELHEVIAAGRVMARYRKHFDNCQGILEQIVDLVMKVGEYRLLTGNLIPMKMMREWKELFFRGKPLYDRGCLEELPADPTPEQVIEADKQEILNDQDYGDYTSMTGEWAWPEGEGPKPPPSVSNFLEHAVLRLHIMVNPPKPATPPPVFPRYTLKACVLGKPFSGKSTCLARIAQVLGIHVLPVGDLIQEALAAQELGECEKSPEGCGTSIADDMDQEEEDSGMGEESSQNSGLPVPEHLLQGARETSKLSLAQHGAAVEKVLRTGSAIPDQLLVDIVVEAIRAVPADSGWILDGFPVTLNQAKLLEKALGGSDAGKEGDWRDNRRGDLSLDSTAPKETPPPCPPVLDLALLLDVTDTQVLSRAAKQACAEKSSGQARVGDGDETSDPPGQHVREQSDVTTRDQSLEERQIQHRITGFQDTWPKLEKWFSEKQSILVRLNAETSEDVLVEKVESVLYRAMSQAEKAEEVDLDRMKAPAVGPPVLRVASPAAASAPPLSESASTLANQGLTQTVKNSPQGSYSGMGRNTPGENQAHDKLSKSGLGGDGKLFMSSSLENIPVGNTVPTEHSTATPGSAQWVYMDEPLPKEIPEDLVPYWESACRSYVTDVKAVMQNLRTERILIIHHLFDIREKFRRYLQRPDLKQEFVSQFQQDYNSILEELREDDVTKAEMHQRFDDLRERLWDICDKRREEAEEERVAVMGDGWLEDHTALLINHFATLMQAEVDRCQDTLGLLRDYYKGMYRQGLPEAGSEFTCVPLLGIVEPEEPGTMTDRSKSSERVIKSPTARDNDEDEKKRTKVVPLIARRPASAELASMTQEDLHDHDEKLLQDIYQAALTAIHDMVSVEVGQLEAEENEEAQGQVEVEPLRRMSQTSTAANSGKNRRRAGGRKKAPPTPVQEPCPPTPTKEDTEKALKRSIRTRIRQEYTAALHHEDCSVRMRVELVKSCALIKLKDLWRRAEEAFRAMEAWLGACFISEMNSIDQLAEVVRHHIESATKLQSELTLVHTDFFLNGDLMVVERPPPPPRSAPMEPWAYHTLTVPQLEAFYRQLCRVAPTGVLCSADFREILQTLTSLDIDLWMPETWLVELVSMLTQDSEVLDWRQFLLSAALPWPTPTLAQLLQVLARFKTADTDARGSLTEEQYLQVELWFPSEQTKPLPEDLCEPPRYDRLANLRKFFFLLFCDPDSSPTRVDYVTLLLFFVAHPDPVQGFVRALSVVMGQPLQHHSSSRLLKSVPCMEDGVNEPTEHEEEVVMETEGVAGRGEGVSIPALLKVISHGGARGACHHRFDPNGRSPGEDEEEFVKVYRELGYTAEETIPFSILSQHPVIQDLIEGSTKYQLIV
ncbi:sperm flagellar protein 2 [Esox lucius]|uniref:sperm flagellar protein 2 n=1 Tax=Esox lucius TaxID=8010 RepID=UPI001476A4F3|nr:sperm flagellar protein 2 [Esox lucius]